MSFPSWYHKPTSLDKPYKPWQVIIQGSNQNFPYLFSTFYEAIGWAWFIATEYPALKVFCKRV